MVKEFVLHNAHVLFALTTAVHFTKCLWLHLPMKNTQIQWMHRFNIWQVLGYFGREATYLLHTACLLWLRKQHHHHNCAVYSQFLPAAVFFLHAIQVFQNQLYSSKESGQCHVNMIKGMTSLKWNKSILFLNKEKKYPPIFVFQCYKSLNGSGPAYLSELLHVYTPSHTLCSFFDTSMLKIQQYECKTRGFCTFSCSGPHI